MLQYHDKYKLKVPIKGGCVVDDDPSRPYIAQLSCASKGWRDVENTRRSQMKEK